MKKRVISFLLMLALVVTGVTGGVMTDNAKAAAPTKEVRAIWISVFNFERLGFKNASKSSYTANVQRVFKKVKSNGCNTVYFHVRAFDDAVWPSKTFSASEYLVGSASASKTAYSTYGYDRLKIAIKEAHKQGLKIEAWMNPYRITYNRFLNPASKNSTDRINRAVTELEAYDLDGIHFDDYFYHSKSRYRSPNSATKYAPYVRGTDTKKRPSASTRRANVNKMIRSVYKNVHKKSGWKFGISPAGNVENCMSGGADVKTWMSKSGYLDYIAPQIYWTDNWGSSGNVKMYSDRLAQWKGLNKINKDMYIGLYATLCGQKIPGDRGWSIRSTNLKTMVSKMRQRNLEGYVLFDITSMYNSCSKREITNLKNYLYPPKRVYPTSVKITSTSVAYVGKAKKISASFSPSSTTVKSLTYKSSDTSIATISNSGYITGKKAGYVRIYATTKNGKTTSKRMHIKNAKIKVMVSELNGRRGPGTNYRTVTHYNKGAVRYITRYKNGWGKISGKNIWIYLKYGYTKTLAY